MEIELLLLHLNKLNGLVHKHSKNDKKVIS